QTSNGWDDMVTLLVQYVLFVSLYIMIVSIINNSRNRFWFLHFVIMPYILFLITITIIPVPNIFQTNNEQFLKSVILFPFRDIIIGYAYAKREALLNLLMMVPFGFFLTFMTKKNVWKTVIITFCFSLSIETIQLLTVLFNRIDARTFDVTDLITNTLGGLCGYIIHRFVRKKCLSGNTKIAA